MKNDFTTEDIKDSLMYKWRDSQIKQSLYAWLGAVAVTIVATLVLCIIIGFKTIYLLFWLAFMAIVGIFIGVIISCAKKEKEYLLNNYLDFDCYEVTLDSFKTSKIYKNPILYSVKIDYEGVTKTVDAYPYFSDSSLSKLSPSEYNGSKVIGVYDHKNDKFYIIKKTESMQENN